MKSLVAAAVVTIPLVVLPSLASAADPAWTCRASAAYLAAPGQDRIEPLAANATRPDCADDGANLISHSSSGITQINAFAVTTSDPDDHQPAVRTVTASGGADSTSIQSGTLSISATAARADVTARCVGGQPAYTDSGRVAGATINGQTVSGDEPITQAGDGLNGSPVGGLIRVAFNEVTASPTTDGYTVTRRAIHVVVIGPDGATLREAVVGEAMAGRSGDVCTARETPPTGGSCPAGATYDPATGYCVRVEVVGPVSASGECPSGSSRGEANQCIRQVVVSSNSHSIGGSAGAGGPPVALSSIPGAAKSPCRSLRFGKKLVAIRGTNGRDRVTGTNMSDR